MKEIAIATLLATAALAASALEVGVIGTRDYAGTNSNGAGITLGTKVGPMSLTAAIEHNDTLDQTRMSVVADRSLTTIGPVTVLARAGVAHLNNKVGTDGYAMTVGIGTQYSLTKSTVVAVAFDRQYGQDRVQSFDGNRVSVGLKTRF
jgi:opacity protein-like surface antigen